MIMWNPWRGCKKCSDGCLYCYIHKADLQRGINPNMITRTKDFELPIMKTKSGNYKMKPNEIELCVSTDFLIEEADAWRADCWKMIKERSDCTFSFTTKRIERFLKCIPEDWGDGYDNVIVFCTVENQKIADRRLGIFQELPIRHKCIMAQPLLERINIEKYLDNVERVMVGGESNFEARPLDYDWVVDIRKQCVRKKVNFEFRQCGSNYIKEGKNYRLQPRDLAKQAKLENLNYMKREKQEKQGRK